MKKDVVSWNWMVLGYSGSGIYVECKELYKKMLDLAIMRSNKVVVINLLMSWLELNGLNFEGFYTVLLERDDEIICVATIRVYREKVAEVPLVATRSQYRQQGMCRILMDELEKANQSGIPILHDSKNETSMDI
ncbi:increased DNA methylation 1-like [Quillaja saponaria]|uniref:Increased DNA methylation 1-like n=1 Tax=Quillaja saponaria TaxID=32244 RepID=A0AAD7Q7L0_QUISA|nr:increased DNA methylation 1-like [Quillaja saponaria]